MSTPRSGNHGKRILPNIPAANGVKRGVNFNIQTIETSIGGTQTPGRLKYDPLSPMNRLSSDELSRSENSSSTMEEQSDCGLNDAICDFNAPLCSNSTVKSDANVSVEISVSSKHGNYFESDKENFPNSPRNSHGLNSHHTPVRGNHYLLTNGIESPQVHVYSPSPNMKFRYGTPRRHTLDEKLLGTPECYNVVHLDKNRYDFGLANPRIDDGEDSTSVTVAVRVRPYSQRYKYINFRDNVSLIYSFFSQNFRCNL